MTSEKPKGIKNRSFGVLQRALCVPKLLCLALLSLCPEQVTLWCQPLYPCLDVGVNGPLQHRRTQAPQTSALLLLETGPIVAGIEDNCSWMGHKEIFNATCLKIGQTK